jgi:chromosome segregation ATPase
MAIIDAEHPAAHQSSREFLEDELKNYRILLADVNKRIHKLEAESYTFDTGQTNQSVKRSSLESLVKAKDNFLEKIFELEEALGISTRERAAAVQVVPW